MYQFFEVELAYKSGKVEIAKIKISEYTEALEQLCKEGRLTSIVVKRVI